MGPLDYVNPPAPMGMDPFFLAGLGMLGQAGQPGPVGIGQGVLQGLATYSQMQGANTQNQLAQRQMASTEVQNELARRRLELAIGEAQRAVELESLEREERAKALASASPEDRPYLTLGVKPPKRTGGAWEGSGFQAQAANMYNNLQAKVAAGEPLTAQDQNNLSISYQVLTAPKTLTTPEGTYTYPGMQLPAPVGMAGAPSSLGPPIAGGPPAFTPKPLSETKLKTRSFFERAANANTELLRLEGEGYDPSEFKPGVIRDYLGSRMKESPDVLTSLFGTAITSEEGNLYAGAAGEFIAANLRYESGAAVPESEFSRYYSIYIPQSGEGPRVKAAKARRRESAVQALATAGDVSDEEYRKLALEQMEKDAKRIPLPRETQPASATSASPATGNPLRSPSGHVQLPF